MRQIILSSLAVVALVGAAAAQTATPDIRPGHTPGVGPSFPASSNASNITRGDTSSTIAPRLPAPAGGENGSAGQFLADAQRALDSGRTGLAQESLERAETAMLQRSVPADRADVPSHAADVSDVRTARDALVRHDIPAAKQAVAMAMVAGR